MDDNTVQRLSDALDELLVAKVEFDAREQQLAAAHAKWIANVAIPALTTIQKTLKRAGVNHKLLKPDGSPLSAGIKITDARFPEIRYEVGGELDPRHNRVLPRRALSWKPDRGGRYELLHAGVLTPADRPCEGEPDHGAREHGGDGAEKRREVKEKDIATADIVNDFQTVLRDHLLVRWAAEPED